MTVEERPTLFMLAGGVFTPISIVTGRLRQHLAVIVMATTATTAIKIRTLPDERVEKTHSQDQD